MVLQSRGNIVHNQMIFFCSSHRQCSQSVHIVGVANIEHTFFSTESWLDADENGTPLFLVLFFVSRFFLLLLRLKKAVTAWSFCFSMNFTHELYILVSFLDWSLSSLLLLLVFFFRFIYYNHANLFTMLIFDVVVNYRI